MTDPRAAKIPDNIDEVLDVAHEAAKRRWATGSADTTQMLLSVDAALEAALPYLVQPWEMHHHIRAVRDAGYIVTVPGTAPAGDGGLREALEKMASAHEQGGGHVSGYFAHMLNDLLDAHPAAPAVPQPVDREALEQMAAEWRQSADEDERYLNRAHASEIHDVYASIRINREHADAVLALLAGGEQS